MERTTTSPEPSIDGPIAGVRRLSTCISVRDMDQAAGWYRQHLGFEMVQRMDLPDYGARIAYLECAGVRLELLQSDSFRPGTRPDPPTHGDLQGPTQVSLEVDSVDAAAERIRARSLTVAMAPLTAPELGLRVMFIRDGEGNLVELVERLDRTSVGGET